MKIIVAGCGKAGYAIMRRLIADGHTVCIIDTSSTALGKLDSSYEVLPFCGSCIDEETLVNADIEHSDVVVCFTGSDDVNLLCCLLAKKLNPTICTIPRVRNKEHLRLAEILSEEFGISMVVSPDRDAANEIYMLMQFPAFLKRESFAKGRVEIVQLRVTENSKLCNARISGLEKIMGCKTLVCAVMRGKTAFIPDGATVFEKGDDLYITAQSEVLSRMVHNLGLQKKIKNVMIVGGDRISVHLSKMLLKSNTNVKLIESDTAKSERLTNALSGASVINDDGARQDVLDRQGCGTMDALVTLTGLDEVNMIVSMYGSSQGVPKVITKINRIETPAMLSGMNLGTVVSSTHLSSERVSHYIAAMELKEGSVVSIHTIADGQVEAMEFQIDENAAFVGVQLSKIPFKSNLQLSCITHNGRNIIPDGNSRYFLGDTVIVTMTGDRRILHFDDIFDI